MHQPKCCHPEEGGTWLHGARRGPTLENYVVTALVALLCRTTKLCWFDDDQFRNIVEDSKHFFEKGTQSGSQVHCSVRASPLFGYSSTWEPSSYVRARLLK